MVEVVLAAVVLLVCCGMLLMMALGAARRQRLQRWWRDLRSSHRLRKPDFLKPESAPGREQRAAPPVERNGNVYRPKAFKGRKRDDPPLQ
jgi:hypothetical protein